MLHRFAVSFLSGEVAAFAVPIRRVESVMGF